MLGIRVLQEKDLVHKLFKVLVPRYQKYETSFTQIWNLPVQYPGSPIPRAVLELKGRIVQITECQLTVHYDFYSVFLRSEVCVCVNNN